MMYSNGYYHLAVSGLVYLMLLDGTVLLKGQHICCFRTLFVLLMTTASRMPSGISLYGPSKLGLITLCGCQQYRDPLCHGSS